MENEVIAKLTPLERRLIKSLAEMLDIANGKLETNPYLVSEYMDSLKVLSYALDIPMNDLGQEKIKEIIKRFSPL